MVGRQTASGWYEDERSGIATKQALAEHKVLTRLLLVRDTGQRANWKGQAKAGRSLGLRNVQYTWSTGRGRNTKSGCESLDEDQYTQTDSGEIMNERQEIRSGQRPSTSTDSVPGQLSRATMGFQRADGGGRGGEEGWRR